MLVPSPVCVSLSPLTLPPLSDCVSDVAYVCLPVRLTLSLCLADNNIELSPTNATRVGEFDSLWEVYIETLAVGMDLFELDSDSALWFGNGMKGLSAMLASEEYIAKAVNPRQLLWSTFSVLSSSNESLHNDTPLICDLIHACRAVLYLRGTPSLNERGFAWDHFVSNTPLESDTHITRWSQWVLAELGAPEVLSSLADSTEPSVKLANIRFGTALLAGCNRKMQGELAVV